MMSDMCRCSYFVNETPIINNKECPKFDRDHDAYDDDFTMCSHVLIRDAKGYCEINFKGERS
jgi:hypothetical protein